MIQHHSCLFHIFSLWRRARRGRFQWQAMVGIQHCHWEIQKRGQLSANVGSPHSKDEHFSVNMGGKSIPWCVQTTPAVPSISCPDFRWEGRASNASRLQTSQIDRIYIFKLDWIFVRARYNKKMWQEPCLISSAASLLYHWNRSIWLSFSLSLIPSILSFSCSSSRWVTTTLKISTRGSKGRVVDIRNQKEQVK